MRAGRRPPSPSMPARPCPGFALMLARVFWIPLACLVAVEYAISPLEGWGAWAAAPMLLLPLGLALVIGAAGAVRCILEYRAATLRAAHLVYTLLAASPLLWLVLRR